MHECPAGKVADPAGLWDNKLVTIRSCLCGTEPCQNIKQKTFRDDALLSQGVLMANPLKQLTLVQTGAGLSSA